VIEVLPGFLGLSGRSRPEHQHDRRDQQLGGPELSRFPRDKLGDVFDRITRPVQLEPAEIYKTTITA
jgi:hypothetical protein